MTLEDEAGYKGDSRMLGKVKPWEIGQRKLHTLSEAGPKEAMFAAGGRAGGTGLLQPFGAQRIPPESQIAAGRSCLLCGISLLFRSDFSLL